ncbi:hypothetical protein QBC36DRAFT_72765 [Triangularia setosa]|uniref:Cyclase n=1 Tax=Triangularia setosa TaxID=2587417 RepID=A0AAN7A8R3_9PEZI|nr:hypothetical protein QBC36DRAFT_72765 [Podospora setosa]
MHTLNPFFLSLLPSLSSAVPSSKPPYKLNSNGIPPFSSLPLNPPAPYLSAWGLYGPKDELGTLNRLTPGIVASASKSEIKTGVRISLNWAMNAQGNESFINRGNFGHKIYPAGPYYDEIWDYNSQLSSHWDSLRHFPYVAERRFYNGVRDQDVIGEVNSTVNGIHVWSEKGIVGRGVLVDFESWRRKQLDKRNPEERFRRFDPFKGETAGISLEDVKAVLKWQGTKVKFGDILIVRSGWTVAFNNKTREEVLALQRSGPISASGLEQSLPMMKFIWENFSAVAGDMPGVEANPSRANFTMHEVMLAGWGCPLGELFDLEALAEEAKRQKRWSFFLTSEVINLPGALASPINALAIF